MALDREFQRKISDRPRDLIFCLVVSILLHAILLIEAKDWLPAFLAQPKREPSEPIAIEFVDVPPSETKPPPQTQRRAANDSVAGGQAKPERPVSAARSQAPVKSKTFASSPKNSPARASTQPSPPKSAQSAAILPNRSPQRQQTPQKNAAAPTIPKPQPKPQVTAPVPATPELKPQPQATTAVPTIPQPQPKPQEPVAAVPTSKPQSKPPTSTTPQPQLPTPPKKNNLPPSKSASGRVATRSAAKVPSPSGRSPTGAASKLGGPVTLSSRNLGGDLPNSNRSNRGAAGIDVRRDVDIGSYLQQLQQQVRQQWIPGITQSSRRTVVYFNVSRSGQLRGLRVVRPSGSGAIDSAALSAIQRAAPFGPLPAGYADDSINIRFTFNINIYGELELRAR